jgi:hypothetical protein
MKNGKQAMRVHLSTKNLIELIMEKYDIDELDALRNFYASETYRLLADEETKTWWYSAHMLLDIYETEKVTGSPYNMPSLRGLVA